MNNLKPSTNFTNIKCEVRFTRYYTYNVSILHKPRYTSDILVIQVDEKLNGNYTEGGINFHVILQSNEYLDMCYYTYYDDHFNGRYTIECGLFPGCNLVTVELDFYNFNAYTNIHLCPSFKKHIHNITVCINDQKKEWNSIYSCEASQSFTNEAVNMVWRNVSNTLQLSRYGCKETGTNATKCLSWNSAVCWMVEWIANIALSR